MNDDEKLDRLDGLFAYDSGCSDSGIKDDSFKNYLSNNHDELGKLLTKLARQYLSDTNYTIEDIAQILNWAERELNFYLT